MMLFMVSFVFLKLGFTSEGGRKETIFITLNSNAYFNVAILLA
jgi:hypothetical protein